MDVARPADYSKLPAFHGTEQTRRTDETSHKRKLDQGEGDVLPRQLKRTKGPLHERRAVNGINQELKASAIQLEQIQNDLKALGVDLNQPRRDDSLLDARNTHDLLEAAQRQLPAGGLPSTQVLQTELSLSDKGAIGIEQASDVSKAQIGLMESRARILEEFNRLQDAAEGVAKTNQRLQNILGQRAERPGVSAADRHDRAVLNAQKSAYVAFAERADSVQTMIQSEYTRMEEVSNHLRGFIRLEELLAEVNPNLQGNGHFKDWNFLDGAEVDPQHRAMFEEIQQLTDYLKEDGVNLPEGGWKDAEGHKRFTHHVRELKESLTLSNNRDFHKLTYLFEGALNPIITMFIERVHKDHQLNQNVTRRMTGV